MRFSDMMGSGAERSRKGSDNDSTISDVLAPYVEEPASERAAVDPSDSGDSSDSSTDAPEGSELEQTERTVAVDTAVSFEPLPTPEPAPTRAHTVEAGFPVVPVVPVEPLGGREREPVPAPAASTSLAAELADFTPLS